MDVIRRAAKRSPDKTPPVVCRSPPLYTTLGCTCFVTQAELVCKWEYFLSSICWGQSGISSFLMSDPHCLHSFPFSTAWPHPTLHPSPSTPAYYLEREVISASSWPLCVCSAKPVPICLRRVLDKGSTLRQRSAPQNRLTVVNFHWQLQMLASCDRLLLAALDVSSLRWTWPAA